MVSIIRKLKSNLFILFVGIIYCFSFSGLNLGDSFFRIMERGYPLFYTSSFGSLPLWHGFEPVHFLNVPTMRLIQLAIAKLRLFPNPLFLQQLINLSLGLLTLKVIYSILLRIKIDDFMVKVTTVLFAFSYGFYANMNGEMHHFGVFLLAASLLLLLDLVCSQEVKKRSIFGICLCLGLLPLYHIETIIYSGTIVFYILFKKDLRIKFKGQLALAIFGFIILPFFLLLASIFFHYVEAGKPNISEYISSMLLPRWRLDTSRQLFLSAYSKISFNSLYIMFRSHLESFSIISRIAKLAQQYKMVTFYSNSFFANSTLMIVVLYSLSFLSVNAIAAFYLIRNWRKAPSFVKILSSMLVIYLIFYGMFFSNYALLSEFYITSVMIHCIILGFVFNAQIRKYKLFYYLLVILTIISNIALFIYPQKVSAHSISTIFDEIESKNPKAEEIVVARVSFFDFPYNIGERSRFKLYFDEHAYESESNLVEYINTIDSEFDSGKKVYLIAPGFLFGNAEEININSLFIMGPVEYKQHVFKNLKRFLKYINKNYQITVVKKHSYNFATLGQFGKLAVVELKSKRNTKP